MTTIDWASLKKHADEATRPIPDGWYDVTVEKAEATVASTGSDMIKVVLRVVGGPHNDRPLWTNFVLTPDNGFALGIFFKSLAAFGVDPAQVSPGGGLEPVAQSLIGRSARAEVGHRTWQGQERNEIQNLVAPQGGQIAAPGQVGGPTAPAGGPPVPSGIPTPAPAPAPTPAPAPAPEATQQVPQGDGPTGPPPLPF